ncbi:MAG: hypothetical protein ACOX88_10560 [Christensenellales bacterium]|jgi:hypothetical protein
MPFDKQKAVLAVTAMLEDMASEKDLSNSALERFASAAVDADVAYMQKEGILEGKAYYDDDDAFDYIVAALVEKAGLAEDEAMDMAEMIDAYMQAMQDYLEEEGLLSWE